jgi:hypothetical protein
VRSVELSKECAELLALEFVRHCTRDEPGQSASSHTSAHG